jgi:hypothetical protein
VLLDGEVLFDGPPGELGGACVSGEDDFERAFLAFLKERGSS